MNLQALHKLGYGVYVICSRKGDKLNGQIANSVFQVTSEPPIVAVSINRKNLTNEYIKDSKVFTVSVLCQDTPLPFIGHFGFKSGRDGDKLPGIGYKTGVTGAPVVLENVVSYFEAKVIQEIDVLTHTIFIGEIIGAELVADKVTMTYDYYQQVKRGKTPAAAPSYIAPEKKEIIPVTDKTDKYVCKICGYIYDPVLGDPDSGIKPGTSFADLPADWSCPVCGADKSQFEKAI